MNKEIIVHLKGGLGNQMFQYALGRSLSLRNSADLYLDQSSGFILDFRYKRVFELGALGIKARTADASRWLPFWYEQIPGNTSGLKKFTVCQRPWGTYLYEGASLSPVNGIADYDMNRPRLWLRGYWQSENYFSEFKTRIVDELSPPRPTEPIFLKTAELMEKCQAVAVGVRLFEEMPAKSLAGVGGITPLSFYRTAALRIAESVIDPVFFVFCTINSPLLHRLELPGRVFHITRENGFAGSLQSLWLLTQCRYHILSNSSYYWWGAWLAEQRNPETTVYAAPYFPNRETVPKRWQVIQNQMY